MVNLEEARKIVKSLETGTVIRLFNAWLFNGYSIGDPQLVERMGGLTRCSDHAVLMAFFYVEHPGEVMKRCCGKCRARRCDEYSCWAGHAGRGARPRRIVS